MTTGYESPDRNVRMLKIFAVDAFVAHIVHDIVSHNDPFAK